MSHGLPDNYLESKTLTAPPQRLHLMLLEGALRFGRQAEQAMRGGDFAAAAEPLMRMLDIVGELLAGVRARKSEISRRLAELYRFLFRLVGQAKVNDDVAQLAEALRLLDYERESWQQLCDKLSNENGSATSNPGHRSPLHSMVGWNTPTGSGFSLEA